MIDCYRSEYFAKIRSKITKPWVDHDLWKFEKHVRKNDIVLDFGCGGGYYLSKLKAKRKIGVDIDDQSLHSARDLGLETYSDIDKVPDDSVDVAISNHALEYTHNPHSSLESIYKKLKPGGKVVFVVPLDITNKKWKKNNTNKQMYTWNCLTLGTLFQSAGFKVLSIKHLRHRMLPMPGITSKLMPKKVFYILSVLNAHLTDNYQIKVVAQRPYWVEENDD